MTITSTAHKYTHKKLTKITGCPRARDIIKLQGEVYANAISLPTKPSNQWGHLGMLAPPAEWLLLPGNVGPYVPPPEPGNLALNAAVNTRNNYERAEGIYATYLQGQTDLKAQILEAVEDEWTSALTTMGWGYAQVNAAQLFAHLKTTYGALTENEISENRAKLYMDWNDNEPIRNLWARIASICALSAYANQPIAEYDKLRETMLVLLRTRKYKEQVRKWMDKDPVTKTWDNFEKYFNMFEENETIVATATTAGYHGANAADGTIEDMIISPTKPATAAMAAATTKQGRVLNFHLPKTACAMQYCHTCGYSTKLSHDSVNCKQKGEKHNDTATAFDRKGGSREWEEPTPRVANKSPRNKQRTSPNKQKKEE